MAKGSSEPNAAGGGGGTPSWLRFFESASGPTLITVLLGGIFGTLITNSIERAAAARERVRSERKALVEARLKTVHEAFALLGKVVGTTEDLVASRGPEWSLSRFPDEKERQSTRDQLHAIHQDYNETDSAWRSKQYTYALLLAYYHPQHEDVPESWATLRSAVGGYVSCSRAWAVANTAHAAYAGQCDAARGEVDAAVLRLSRAVDSGAFQTRQR